MEDERQLIRRAKNGDREAFMVLVKRYEKPIYQLIFRLTGNREDAADLTQETMLKAFKALKSFQEKSSFHTWLHRIAVNLSLNFLKRNRAQKNQLEYLDNRLNEETEFQAVSVADNWQASEELREKLEKALEELPLLFKTTFSLVVFQGMSHRQAAEVLGCSEGTVSWRVHESRKMLREKLKSFINQNKEF
jgi:RNA polymerase sigma-70 factor (ECF subfamily)